MINLSQKRPSLNEEFLEWSGTPLIIQGIMSKLIKGTNQNDTLNAYSGDTLEGLGGNDTLSVYAYSFTGNVFRGGVGNDSYTISYGGFGIDQYGSRIEDSAGKDSLIVKGNFSSNPIDLNLDGFFVGVVGVARQKQNLLIDLDADGEFLPEDDLVIVDFYNATGKGPGKGHIETINNLSGKQIINQVSVLGSNNGTGITKIIKGTEKADTLKGTNNNDSLVGLGGNDSLFGLGKGNDTLIGGSGDDTLKDVGTGNDLLKGDAGNDVLSGGEGDDVMLGGLGNDSLDGGGGKDKLLGEAGNDTLTGGYGGQGTLNGGAGNDSLWGYEGNLLLGGDDQDTLISHDSNVTLDGGAGNDSLSISSYGFTGNVFRGGGGNDTYEVRYGWSFGQGGIEIKDTAGTKDKLLLKAGYMGDDMILSPDGLAAGTTGFARKQRNLVIDLSNDGKFLPEDDLVIVDFFNAAGTGAGKGFIETVGTFKGSEIITTVKDNNLIIF